MAAYRQVPGQVDWLGLRVAQPGADLDLSDEFSELLQSNDDDGTLLLLLLLVLLSACHL